MAQNQANTGKVNIRGKEYKTVALRVNEFHEAYADEPEALSPSLITEIILNNQTIVVMKASIVDSTGRVLATGHAEEVRGSTNINRTSALENAETSAIGRALAAFGFGGTEFASANEVQGAIKQQNTKVPPEKVVAINAWLAAGALTEAELEQRFGHAVVPNLLDVEADRIITHMNSLQKEQ